MSKPKAEVIDKNHLWNKQISPSVVYKQMVSDLLLGRFSHDKSNGNNPRKLAILVIALRNGCRRHEAVEAYNKYVKSRKLYKENDESKRWVQVVVEKKGYIKPDKKVISKKAIDWKRKDGTYVKRILTYRRVIIPSCIPHDLGEYKSPEYNIWDFSNYYYHWNPHTLRYAFITKSSETLMPQIIAKITGHSSLQMIEEYVSEDKANKALAEFKP